MSYRRSRGGGSGISGIMGGKFGGTMVLIMGAVLILVCMIAYTIAIGQMDTSYTAAAAYTEQQGLAASMGMGPMIIFLIFMFLGLGGVIGGAVMNVRTALGAGGLDSILSAIMGAVTIVIILVLNGLIQTELHAAYVATNATVNKASFTGVLGIMGVWGMVIYWTLLFAGIAQIGAGIFQGGRKMLGKA